jgi:hypothetical protein
MFAQEKGVAAVMKDLAHSRTMPFWLGSMIVWFGTIFCLGIPAFAEDGLWKPESTLAVVTVDRSGGPILIPVKIGNREGRFLLDTGAARTICDQRFLADARKTNATAFSETQGAPTEPQLCELPSFYFGGIPFTQLKRVASMDLNRVQEWLDTEIDGILGMDVLHHFVTHIDVDHGAVVFAKEIDEDVPGAEILLVSGNACPAIEGVIHPDVAPLQFLIDTGDFSSGKLDFAVCCSLLKSRQLEPTGLWLNALGANGNTASLPQVRTPTIEVGGWEHKNIAFTPGRYNDLGLHFLCRHRVTIDPTGGKLYLMPSSLFALRDREDYSGIAIHFEDNGRKMVSSVISGSIAEKAGAVAGDEILEVNGKSAEQMSRAETSRLLRYPSRQDLVLRLYRYRMGKSLRITIPER